MKFLINKTCINLKKTFKPFTAAAPTLPSIWPCGNSHSLGRVATITLVWGGSWSWVAKSRPPDPPTPFSLSFYVVAALHRRASSVLHRNRSFVSLPHWSGLACDIEIPAISFSEVFVLLAFGLGDFSISRSPFWEIHDLVWISPLPSLCGGRFSQASRFRVPFQNRMVLAMENPIRPSHFLLRWNHALLPFVDLDKTDDESYCWFFLCFTRLLLWLFYVLCCCCCVVYFLCIWCFYFPAFVIGLLAALVIGFWSKMYVFFAALGVGFEVLLCNQFGSIPSRFEWKCFISWFSIKSFYLTKKKKFLTFFSKIIIHIKIHALELTHN